MRNDLDQLRREVDGELAGWAQRLDAPAMSVEARDRLRSVVRGYGSAWRARQRLLWIARPVVGIAAAAVLLLFVPAWWTSAQPAGSRLVEAQAETLLDDWMDAADQSTGQIANVLSREWLFTGFASPSVGDDDYDSLESLDESFERIEQLLGA